MNVLRDTSSLWLFQPFQFDPERFDQVSAAVTRSSADPVSPGEKEDCAASSLLEFREIGFDTDGMLPHIADYLVLGCSVPTARRWRARLRTAHNPRTGVLMLGELVIRRGGTDEPALAFEVRDLIFVLFRSGIGFVAAKIRPESTSPVDWLDIIHYLRFGVRARVSLPHCAGVEHGSNDTRADTTLHAFFQRLLGGLIPAQDGFQWWDDVFVRGRLLTFSSIQVVGGDDMPEPWPLEYLCRLRRGSHSLQDIRFASEDLQPNHAALVPYAENHWFYFALEGGGMFGLNPPDTPYFRSHLAGEIDRTYMFTFLLVQFQRFALVSLERSVAENWLLEDDGNRMRRFDRIRGRLLEFTARGYCTQAMQRDVAHSCYRKWQEICETEGLYREVAAEVREMYDDLQLRSARESESLAQRLNDIALVFAVVSLAVGVLAAINDAFPEGAKLPWWSIAAVAGAALCLAIPLRRALQIGSGGKTRRAAVGSGSRALELKKLRNGELAEKRIDINSRKDAGADERRR